MIVNERKTFSITTLVLLATSISTSAFYPTLSGHKSGNLLSYRAQTTTNQNASRCSVAISFIKSNGNNSYIESASDKLGSHESGRALNATVSNGAYNALVQKDYTRSIMQMRIMTIKKIHTKVLLIVTVTYDYSGKSIKQLSL